jgi:hypothetical protein
MSQMPSTLNDPTCPIDNMLDGSHYNMRAQNMGVFLKGRKLWCYVSGEVSPPTQQEGETKDDYATCLED